MAKQISNNTIAVLAMLAILVMASSTFIVTSSIDSAPVYTQTSTTPATPSAHGYISVGLPEKPVTTSGTVSLEIAS